MIMMIFHFITQNKFSDNYNNNNNSKNDNNNNDKNRNDYYFIININQVGKIERRKKGSK